MNEYVAHDIRLRDISPEDLPVFFAHQLDPEASRMAAFTAEDPTDQDAFIARWRGFMADDRIHQQTVLVNGAVAGHVVCFIAPWSGLREVGYWIGREFWGQGVATRALTQFLRHVQERPLYARAASDNTASIRVLQKCGFTLAGREVAFASARGEEIDESIFKLAG